MPGANCLAVGHRAAKPVVGGQTDVRVRVSGHQLLVQIDAPAWRLAGNPDQPSFCTNSSTLEQTGDEGQWNILVLGYPLRVWQGLALERPRSRQQDVAHVLHKRMRRFYKEGSSQQSETVDLPPTQLRKGQTISFRLGAGSTRDPSPSASLYSA